MLKFLYWSWIGSCYLLITEKEDADKENEAWNQAEHPWLDFIHSRMCRLFIQQRQAHLSSSSSLFRKTFVVNFSYTYSMAEGSANLLNQTLKLHLCYQNPYSLCNSYAMTKLGFTDQAVHSQEK